MGKKLLPLLLITLISLNTFGFDLILEYLIYSCKLDFKEHAVVYIKKGEIQVFKMSSIIKNNFSMRGNEIKYNGHMYDIVKTEKNENDIFIYCIRDSKEDELYNIIDKRSSDNNSPSKLIRIQKHLAKIYLHPHANYPNLNTGNLTQHFYPFVSYSSFYGDINSPPPDIII